MDQPSVIARADQAPMVSIAGSRIMRGILSGISRHGLLVQHPTDVDDLDYFSELINTHQRGWKRLEIR